MTPTPFRRSRRPRICTSSMPVACGRPGAAFGAVPEIRDGVEGVCFRVWAPNAERVSVVGDFNAWDGRVHQMATLGASGVWELFVPELRPGALYRFELRLRGGAIKLKSDPYARAFERRPATACRVTAPAHMPGVMRPGCRQRPEADWLGADERV
jgi:1,4-alpha-glucan branching enzyme